MTRFALLPGFDPRANVDFKPAGPSKASKHLNPEPSRPLSPPPPLRRGAISDADVEALALALLAADERCPAVTITDRARALEYRRGDARRQLAIILRAGEAVAAYPSDEAERAEERARLDAYAAEREAVQ